MASPVLTKPEKQPWWKRLAIISLCAGAGFAVCSALILGAALWYSSRPKPPKPWNTTAITAEYDYVTTEGDKAEMEFYYTLQNNTDLDVNADATDVKMGGQLGREHSTTIDTEYVKGKFPVFLPARGRVRFGIHISYPYPEGNERKGISDDERYDFQTRLAKYVSAELSNLNGFVMYHESTRYEILLPNGWGERAKQPLKVKGEQTKSSPK